MKKIDSIALVVLLALATAACKRDEIKSLPPRQTSVVVPPPSVQPVPELPHTCPNHEEVRVSRTKCEKLISEAKRILKSQSKKSPLFDAPSLTTEVQNWRESYEDWKEHNTNLFSNCDSLLGADGTQVYPEIPASLKCLTLAGIWLRTSVDLLEASENDAASSYLKGASAASTRAGKILDGELCETSRSLVLPIPKAVRKISL